MATLDGLDFLIMTTPQRKESGTLLSQEYTDAEVNNVKAFVESGKSVVVSGLSNRGDIKYAEDETDRPYKVSTQMNKMLSAIGANTRIADDTMADTENFNGTGSTNYKRLRFANVDSKGVSRDVVNNTSEFTEGITDDQEYSVYAGSNIKVLDNSKVTNLISTYDTTGSVDILKQPR